MAVVAIVLVLAALAGLSGVYGLGRARMNTAVFDVAALISRGQLRAMSRGAPHYLFFRQTADGRIRVQLLERPDSPALSASQWASLDLTQGPGKALEFTRTLPDGTAVQASALVADQLVLGGSTGPDSGGLAFLDLDSQRIQRPLPAPFSTLVLTSAATAPEVDRPTADLLAGCNFCINPSGSEPYGALRFNPNGTVQVVTGSASTGAVIAFAPNTRTEADITPRLLAVSAPAGAAVIF